MIEWTRRMPAGVVLACVTLTIAVATTAWAEGGVGIIAEYKPAAARFHITRAGTDSVPVRIGTEVWAGDRLTLPAGAAVVVQQGDGRRRQFAGPGSFKIPDAAPLGKLSAFFRSISTVFDDEYRLAGTAASRGGDGCRVGDGEVRSIEVPILAGKPALVAGERDLPLAWLGGCTPFTVSLHAVDGSTLYRESVEGRQARLDDVPLAVGQYSVVIEDATGLMFRGSVEVVSTAPEMPSDISGDHSPLGVIAGAIWLAEQDGGRWRFDSFERLRPLIRAGDPLAGVIGDGVLWGHYGP